VGHRGLSVESRTVALVSLIWGRIPKLKPVQPPRETHVHDVGRQPGKTQEGIEVGCRHVLLASDIMHGKPGVMDGPLCGSQSASSAALSGISPAKQEDEPSGNAGNPAPADDIEPSAAQPDLMVRHAAPQFLFG
jgi:hypothetical protein